MCVPKLDPKVIVRYTLETVRECELGIRPSHYGLEKFPEMILRGEPKHRQVILK